MDIKNTEITLCLRNPCNYSCDYCIGNRVYCPIELHDMNKLSKIYQSISPFIFTVFECSTGEPTLHPQIKEILSLCTSYGTVSMPTNNSINPEKWLSKDYAQSIYLNVTIHPQAEKELEDFLDRLIEIKELGTTISLRYIARPDKIDRFLFLKDYFKNKNFTLQGVSFTGIFEGKNYPCAYLEEEKKNFGMAESTYWLNRIQMNMKIKNFEGIPCLAGNTFFCVNSKTVLKRCLYDETLIDTPYIEAQPCRIPYCGCYLMLKELNHQTPRYWNNVRALSGYPLLEIETKNNDQLYEEGSRIYQDLMKKYNKI